MINTRVEEKFNSLKVRNIFYWNKITVDTTDVEVNYKDFSKIYFCQLNFSILSLNSDNSFNTRIATQEIKKVILNSFP